MSTGPAGTVSLLCVVVLTIIAVWPELFSPFNPALRVGAPYLGPSSNHLFGTDEIGRDQFSRVIFAIRFTWLPALAITGATFVLGSAIGIASAFAGRWIDQIVQRSIDVIFLVPSMLFAVAIAATLGPGIGNSMIAIMVSWWPWYARLAGDEYRRIKATPHYQAAEMSGTSKWRLVSVYGAPGTLPSLVVAAGLDVSNVITTLSLLSFLGLGQLDPAPELGAMISRSLDSLTAFWWIPIFPAMAVFFLSLVANMFADSARSALRGR